MVAVALAPAADNWRAMPPGEGVAASLVLAEHRGDSSIPHIRVDGVDEWLNAKIGAGHGSVAACQAVGLAPDPAWALTFDATGRPMT